MFCCSHCQRTYQRKLYFDRHVIACEYLSKSKRERALEIEETTDTPSVRELYMIIMTLAAKCNALETKMNTLNGKPQLKLNSIEWLNSTIPPDTTYADWLNGLTISKSELTGLFETDYVVGVVNFLKQHLPPETRPLRAFEKNFYIFQEKWVLCDNETFTKLMQLCDKQVMGAFIQWQNENKKRMANDDSFTETYSRNLKKVMGGNSTREQLYSRIKSNLLERLSQTT
jgi:hypothetical protein